MPSRRWFVAALFGLTSALAARRIARGAGPAALGSGLPSSFDLRKQLETGLKARRPKEFAYIASIVDKVEDGSLPRTLVDQAFLYARKRSTHYPIIYFQFSLKELTKRAGMAL